MSSIHSSRSPYPSQHKEIENDSSCCLAGAQYIDYIPIASTFKSLVDLFKMVVYNPSHQQRPPTGPQTTLQSRAAHTHLNQKSFLRCVVLLIPFFGNMVIAIYDCMKFKRNACNLTAPKEPQLPPPQAFDAPISGPFTKEGESRKDSGTEQKATRLTRLDIAPLNALLPGAHLDFSPCSPEIEPDDTIRGQINQVICNPSAFETLEERFRDNEKVAVAAISRYGRMVRYASERLKNDKTIALIAVKNNGEALQYLPDAFKDDFEVVLAAVQQNGAALEFASERLQNDKTIALAAIDNDSIGAWPNVSEELKGNLEMALAIVKKDGNLLRKLNKQFQDNEQVVSQACESKGFAIRYAAQRFREDKKIVRIAIENAPSAIEHVDASLLKDEEIVSAAAKKDPATFRFAEQGLRENRDFVLKLAMKRGNVLQYAAEILKKDPEIVKAAVKQDGRALRFADPSVQKDREIVLAAVQQNGLALQFADKSFENDREVVIVAIEQTGAALKYASKECRGSRDIVLLASNLQNFLESVEPPLRQQLLEESKTLIGGKSLLQANIEEAKSKRKKIDEPRL